MKIKWYVYTTTHNAVNWSTGRRRSLKLTNLLFKFMMLATGFYIIDSRANVCAENFLKNSELCKKQLRKEKRIFYLWNIYPILSTIYILFVPYSRFKVSKGCDITDPLISIFRELNLVTDHFFHWPLQWFLSSVTAVK